MAACIKDRFWFQRMDRTMARLDKATAYKNGLTELSTKDNGTKTKQKAKEPFGMLKETFM